MGAPKLRLDATTVGPLSIAQGANGSVQTINALNAGDSPLNLTATSSATWLSANVQRAQSCGTLGANCNPVSISLNTASLAKGSYTGVITLSDPNAIDAPQTITVTVNIGGGVPDNLTLYVPTNGAPVTQSFNTARPVTTSVNSPSQVNLSIAAPGGGSFATVFSYTLTAKANAGAAEGTYNGSIAVSNSSVAGENKTVPLTLTVTSQPVAQASAISGFRVATGAAKQTQYIAVSNLGSGTLTLAAPTAATTSGGSTWLTTSLVSGFVAITADPTGLQPGSYQGTVTINSNAANKAVAVPVQFDVLPSGAPVVKAGGVVNNATFEVGAQLAQGELPAIFGEQFITGDPQQVPTPPWPTTLGGASVFVNDLPAPVYYVSANQVNFQIPFDAETGPGTVRIDRNGVRGNTVSVAIAKYAPKLLIAVNQAGAVASSPFGGAAAPAQAGTYLTIYALGLGQTGPPVQAGEAAPANPLATVPGTNLVYFGAGGLFSNPISQVPQFIGLSPGFSGLYQINVQIPLTAPKGAAVPVFLQGDVGTSNTLKFNIQ